MEELYDESGFFFRQRKGKLNLRKLEAIDLEKVIREVDIDVLQQFIENITFSEFQDYDIHYLTDKHIVKLFKVAQLTIEYLLFSQRKLVNNLSDLAKKYSSKKR
jgi:zinc finger protein DZIP1